MNKTLVKGDTERCKAERRMGSNWAYKGTVLSCVGWIHCFKFVQHIPTPEVRGSGYYRDPNYKDIAATEGWTPE